MATLVQKTIKASGGDYTSIANLEAANANLVSLDQAWEVTCDNLEETATVTFTGWTTSATCYLKIKAGTPHGSTGRVTANAARIAVATGSALSMTAIGAGGLIIFDGIQLKTSGASSTLISHANNGTITAKVRYQNCVFESAGASGIGFHMGGGAAATNDAEFINCVMISGLRCIYREHRQIFLYGSTFICTNVGGYAVDLGTNDGLSRVVKNCYARGGASGGVAYNLVVGATLDVAAGNDATGSVDNVLYTTANFTNVTAGSEDFNLPAGSALIAAGADRSAEAAPFSYTTDIQGRTRPLTLDDVGAFQTIGAGGGLGAFALGWM